MMIFRYLIVGISRIFFNLINTLPLGIQMIIGHFIGLLCYLFIPKRRKIAFSNINQCLNEKTISEKKQITKNHFISLGKSLIEMHLVWFGDQKKIYDKQKIIGLEYLTNSVAEGRGVILLSAHFATLEGIFCSLKEHCPKLAAMYRVQKNMAWNKIMTKGRSRNIDFLFAHTDIKSMIKSLNDNYVVWYAPDQHYAKKRSREVNFFGQKVSFNSATEDLVKITDCVVLTQFSRRLKDGSYEIEIGCPLSRENLTQEYVSRLEEYILRAKEQYYWVHKRFK